MQTGGRRPELTEDAQSRFRLNRASDDWPDLDTTGLRSLSEKPQLSSQATAAVERARRASAGSDPVEYEIAICDLIEQIGFAATHVGGTGNPDGYADALLGPLAYRVMIECKLAAAAEIAHSDAPVEASKFRETFNGDCCILVAPAFVPGSAFVAELQQHGVSAWTTQDLISLVQSQTRAFDARKLFESRGIASDYLEDFQWSREHGAPKRLRVLASLVMRLASAQQRIAQRIGGASEAAHFTVDVAMIRGHTACSAWLAACLHARGN